MCSTNCLLLSITSHKYLDEVMKIAVMTKLHLFLDEFEYFGRSSTFPTASASSYKSFSLMRPITTAGFKSSWFECEFAKKKSKYAVPCLYGLVAPYDLYDGSIVLETERIGRAPSQQ